MTSREEKNRKYVDEINKEKTINITKKILKVLLIVLIIFTMFFLYARFYEPKRIKTHEYLIKDTSIPNEFNGKKILHISDILYGSTITKNDILKLKQEINLINPDIVIFTGNIIAKDKEISEEEIKFLNDFFSSIPYTIGKYAVSGNMDSQSFNVIMDNTDFEILNNQVLHVYNGINKINIIGINYNNNDEIKNESNDWTITIINDYDLYSKYHLSSNLVFAGHNLGGEIRIFNIPLLGTSKHLNSYYEDGETKVYISNGLGSIHNLRLMNKPSINVYRLSN